MLLALVQFIGTWRRIHCATVPLFTNTFELSKTLTVPLRNPKTSTELHLKIELDAKNLQCMNVCAFHSTVANVCLEM